MYTAHVVKFDLYFLGIFRIISYGLCIDRTAESLVSIR